MIRRHVVSFLQVLHCARETNEYSSYVTLWRRSHMTAPTNESEQKKSYSSLDPKEAAKFAALSSQWWDASGPFAPLHQLNPARCKFIRDAVCSANGIQRECREPLLGLKVLDVGCGGGILSESLARMGASVHGIDVATENIAVAAIHSCADPLVQRRVRYNYLEYSLLACRHVSF
jgi:polyprenyldihydroxybenzoate methyltransferase/3-demethylubiquinol 3-O-methyltransferase